MGTADNPIVWVVQEGKNDYSLAEEFGDVQFVTRGDYNSMKGSARNKEVAHDIRKFKANYLPGVDYIVVVGNPMISMLVAMSLNPGTHKFLKWDGRRAAYIPFELNAMEVK